MAKIEVREGPRANAHEIETFLKEDKKYLTVFGVWRPEGGGYVDIRHLVGVKRPSFGSFIKDEALANAIHFNADRPEGSEWGSVFITDPRVQAVMDTLRALPAVGLNERVTYVWRPKKGTVKRCGKMAKPW